jgi:hypothetical protein
MTAVVKAPSTLQLKDFAHAAVDAGADIFIGVTPTGPREICGSFRDFGKVNAWKNSRAITTSFSVS